MPVETARGDGVGARGRGNGQTDRHAATVEGQGDGGRERRKIAQGRKIRP